jgi:hypothetical protein
MKFSEVGFLSGRHISLRLEQHGPYLLTNETTHSSVFRSGKQMFIDSHRGEYIKVSGGWLIVYDAYVENYIAISPTGEEFILDDSINLTINEKYFMYLDGNIYMASTDDLVKYLDWKHPRIRRQIVSMDVNVDNTELLFINDNFLYVRKFYDIKEIPNPVEKYQLLDIKTGVSISTELVITKISPTGKYFFGDEIIYRIDRTEDVIDGLFTGQIKISALELVPLIPRLDAHGVGSDVYWILEDIVLVSSYDYTESYLINLINMKTELVIGLYQKADELEAGFLFDTPIGHLFIPDRVIMRKARELLSPHTKTNLNILDVIKEIPTSVTDRIGRYV